MKSPHSFRAARAFRAAFPRNAIGIRIAAACCTVCLLGGSIAASGQPAQPLRSTPAPVPINPERVHIPLSDIAGAPAPSTAPATQSPQCEGREVRQAIQKARQFINPPDPGIDNNRPTAPIDGIQFLEALVRQPGYDCYELHFLLALAQARIHRDVDAQRSAEHAISLRFNAADAHFLLGTLHDRQHRGAAAIEQFRTATLCGDDDLNNPRVTAAWFLLGRALQNEGYLTAAEAAYARFDEQVLEVAPEHVRDPDVASLMHERPHGALEPRLALLKLTGETKRALEVVREAQTRRGDDPFLTRLLIRAQLDAGDGIGALETLRQRGEDDDKALLNGPLSLLLEALLKAGKLESWVAILERDVAGGQRVALAAAAAERLDGLDRHDDALRLWRAVACARPRDADAQWHLASALHRSGDLRGALNALITLVRADDPAPKAGGDDPAAARRSAPVLPAEPLAEWMASFRTADEFLKLVQDYGTAGNRDFAADFVYGITAAAAGQDELAAQLFQSCLTARPTFAAAHVAWGRALAARYAWNDARREALAALKIDDEFAAAHALLADALSGLDENDEAEAAYRKAIQFAPTDVGIRLATARHFERLGAAGATAAQRRFAEALQIDPACAPAAESLIRSYLATDKLDLARARLAAAEAADLPEDVLRRARLAVRYVGGIAETEYLNELQTEFTRHPDDWRTAFDLATLLSRLNRETEAAAVAERLRALAPNEEAVSMLLVDLYRGRLEIDAAIAILQQLLDRFPNRVNVLRVFAGICIEDFQLDRGREMLRRLLKLRLEEQLRDALQTQLLATYGMFDDAAAGLPLVDELLTAQPGDADLITRRMQLLVQAGRGAEALKAATDWLDADPTNDGRRRILCWIAQQTNTYRPAIDRLREWVDDHVYDEWADTLAELLVDDGRADEALALIKRYKGSENLEQSYQRRLRLGTYERLAGKISESLAEFEALLKDRGARANPDVARRARDGVVLALIDLGEFDDALSRIDGWAAEDRKGDSPPEPGERLDPMSTRDQVQLLVLRATVLRAAGRDREAIEMQRRVRELQPQARGYDNDLGYYLADAGIELESAAAMIRRALVWQPLNAAFLDSYGWAFYKAGDFAAAQKYLSRSLRIWEDRNAITVLDHLGDAEFRLGNEQAARERWLTARRVGDTTNPPKLSSDEKRSLADVRRKLAALEIHEAPPVAPTAAEQHARN